MANEYRPYLVGDLLYGSTATIGRFKSPSLTSTHSAPDKGNNRKELGSSTNLDFAFK
ncbi:hypothetical protein Scep_019424 [Stephania cephalantha]|uniref:Uncharacterized protein n=1 Tax=Stephania cephalantha TaxID=152367 RepID=A0AAP0IAW1_9MAGN